MKASKLATLLAGLMMATTASAGNWYVNVNAGVTQGEIDSGGLNTAGPHLNTGSDQDDAKLGFLGLGMGHDFGSIRVEAEFTARTTNDFTTNSYQPPVPTFFYDTETQTHTAMLNVLYDFSIAKQWSGFVGAGMGIAFVDITTDDTVVRGSGTEANFAWQGVLGASYQFNQTNNIDIGYRYVDHGESSISLTDGGGASAGSYDADLISHEIFIGWRHSL